MKNKKNKSNISKYILDLNDAIMPKDWPQSIPKLLDLETGKFEKDFDIVIKESDWYNDLKLFVNKNNVYKLNSNLPIGLNKCSLPIGSKILNETKEIIALGKNRLIYEQNKFLEIKKLEEKLIYLKKKFPKIKKEYLIDFNDTQELLLNNNDRHLINGINIYNSFNDIFLAGGGSTYSDKKLASLGSYNSLLDFEVLDQTLSLFKIEEIKKLKKEFFNLAYLSPIFNLINTYIDNLILNENFKKAVNKKIIRK